jgi:twitching motility two-component system response regulator PilH
MSNKKILVIDDEPDFIDAIRSRFEAIGYKIVCANDGNEGVAQARKEHPGLILLDLVMPRSNGFEALSKLKSDPVTSAIPVIVISAKDETDYIFDAGKLGASDYIVKPVSIEALLEHIKKYI